MNQLLQMLSDTVTFTEGFSNKAMTVGEWQPKDPISKHFKFYEMVASNTADANRICNVPTPDEIRNGKELAENVLDRVRDRFGVTLVNSWFRCEELERAITVSGYSNWLRNNAMQRNEHTWKLYFNRKQHPKGMAADIEVRDSGVSNRELFHWIEKHCKFDQLILENVSNPEDPRSGWVHVSYNPYGENRQQAFEI